MAGALVGVPGALPPRAGIGRDLAGGDVECATGGINCVVGGGHQSGQEPATATCAPVVWTASVQAVAATSPRMRHHGAIRRAPMANSTLASSAVRASSPAKYPASARSQIRPACAGAGQSGQRATQQLASVWTGVLVAGHQVCGQHGRGLCLRGHVRAVNPLVCICRVRGDLLVVRLRPPVG